MTDIIKETKKFITALLVSDTKNLRSSSWYLPTPSLKAIRLIQKFGFEKYGEKFKYLGFDLKAFINSPLVSREKDTNGDILFSSPLLIDTDILIYSATIGLNYAQKRLDVALESPFSTYIFSHPGTKWFNLSCRRGMKKYFSKHMPQLLDFFTDLLIKSIKKGKKTILISKKDFKTVCASEIEKRLQSQKFHSHRIVTDKWDKEDLNDPKIIPLIHYGVIGVNLFQHYDSAICLNSYYINDKIVNNLLQDHYASDFHIAIDINTNGSPLRRSATVRDKAKKYYDIAWLSNYVLMQEEMGVVEQAVGRVRPYTMPREVFTFQCSASFHLPYTKDFQSLEEARQYFEIDCKRTRQKKATIASVQNAKSQGMTQKETEKALQISLRTVQNYWKQ